MKIGYACIPLTIDARTNHGFIIKNFNYDNFYKATSHNISDLKKILKHNINNKIYLFRISSDIIPFGSHEINQIKWWDLFKEELQEIGAIIKENNIRVSMHPGQYTVINSPSVKIVEKGLKDLEYHCAFLDSLEVDYSHKLVLHIGGVYNDKTSALERFKKGFNLLSASAKKRLVIENDHRSYTIEDVLKISNELTIPAIFDNLHHELNPSMNLSLKDILGLVSSTWSVDDGSMKLHYSDSSKTKSFGAHSDFIITENFLNYYNISKEFHPDIMLEVKNKDISAIKCINVTDTNLKKSTKYEEWAKYKYLVMEKNYSLYKKCSKLINSDQSIVAFYKLIDSTLCLDNDIENFKNTLLHIWGYFKDQATEKEKEKFLSFFNENEVFKAKIFLGKLTNKYNQTYLASSYYFTNN